MSIYGYCRISTAKQSIDRQIRNIQAEYPTAHIVHFPAGGFMGMKKHSRQCACDRKEYEEK